jgi:aminoglycoside phosphotransferase (APT) family kinase protein
VNRLEAWVARETGGSLSRQLEGSTSSALYEILLDGTPALVARAFTNHGWLAEEPDLALHEAAALRVVEPIDVPTPRLVAVDATGEQAGTPAIVMTRLPGSVHLPNVPSDEWISLLAEPLMDIREAPITRFSWSYDPWIDESSLRRPDWSAHPELWKRAFSTYLSGMPDEPPRFLHRDYHPVNVLWDNGTVSGVVDWVNACVGPPSSDIAHCRLNLALMYGLDTANRFTRMIDPDYDPIWDLAPALSGLHEADIYPPWTTFGLTRLTLDTVRARLERFVSRAC